MKTKPFTVNVVLRQDCVLSLPLFILYMDKIDRESSSSSGITFGQCNVRHLQFADDLALLSSKKSDLQYAPDRFSDACLDAGMKISTAKTAFMRCQGTLSSVVSKKIGVTLKQTEKFIYLGFTFSSDGRQDNKLDKHIGKASPVTRQLYRSVVLKRELCTKAKLAVFRSVFVPIITYGHDCWVMTERMRSRVQAVEMGFLRKVRGLFLLDKAKKY